MLRARRCLNDRLAVGRPQLRERQSRVGRHASILGDIVRTGGSDRDELRAVLLGKGEVADVGLAPRERDRVAGLRVRERRMKIAAGGDDDRGGG
jgi:hypothetical protein